MPIPHLPLPTPIASPQPAIRNQPTRSNNTAAAHQAPPSTLDRDALMFLLAAGLFMYALLFVPPFLPVGFVADVDGLIYALDGERMGAGQVLYRDFFQFSTPGTSALYWFLFRLCGSRLWVPNLLLLIAGLGLAWVGFVVAKKVLRPSVAFLPSAVFLAAIYQNEFDPTHHWLSLLASTAALAVLVERRTCARALAAGVLTGLAACFTQSRGFLTAVGIGLFLCWEWRNTLANGYELLRKELSLAGAFLATFTVASSYFAWRAGIARFFWCTTVFGMRYYPKDTQNNSLRVVTDALPLIPSMVHTAPGTLLYWFFIYLCIPAVNLIFLARYWKRPRLLPAAQWARLMLIAFASFFMLLSVVAAPMSTRVAASSLPGVVLVLWFADSRPQHPRRYSAAFAALVMLIAPLAVFVSQAGHRFRLGTPNGDLAIEGSNGYEEYRWIRDHTHWGDYFLSNSTPIYFYLGLKDPSRVTFLSDTGYNTPQQVEELVQSLDRHEVGYIFWLAPGLGAGSPAPSTPTPLSPLRDYVRAHYQRVRKFPNADEIWKRETQD